MSPPPEEELLPVSAHIKELRTTVIACLSTIGIIFFILLCFYKPLITLLFPEQTLVILSPIEGFTSMLRVAFWGALLISAPIWGYFCYKFFAPALYTQQRGIIIPFLALSFCCVMIGISIAIFAILPLANEYFLLFNSSLGDNLWSLEKYLDYSLLLILATGVAFELGALLFFAIHQGIIKNETLIHYRRHAIVASFILAALLTPPDVLTQILLAIPLCLFYEIGIIYSKIRIN